MAFILRRWDCKRISSEISYLFDETGASRKITFYDSKNCEAITLERVRNKQVFNVFYAHSNKYWVLSLVSKPKRIVGFNSNFRRACGLIGKFYNIYSNNNSKNPSDQCDDTIHSYASCRLLVGMKESKSI